MRKKRVNFVRISCFTGSTWATNKQECSMFPASSKIWSSCSWNWTIAKDPSTNWQRPWNKSDSVFSRNVSKNAYIAIISGRRGCSQVLRGTLQRRSTVGIGSMILMCREPAMQASRQEWEPTDGSCSESVKDAEGCALGWRTSWVNFAPPRSP